jgi:hypothetical protein
MSRLRWVAPLLLLAAAASASSTSHAVSPSPVAGTTALAGETFDVAAFNAKRKKLERDIAVAIAAFDAALAENGAAARREWHEYLHWNKWAEPIQAAGDYRAAELERIAWRLYAAKDGFEHSEINALRSALSDYVTFATAVAEANGDLAGEFRRRRAALESAAAEPASEVAVGEASWWLAATGQAGDELAVLRRKFDYPPVVLQVHRDLVADKLNAFERTSSEQVNQRHVIQGATVVGAANVKATTTAALVDKPSEVRLRIVTHGTVAAPHNVASAGRVRVVSASTAEFTAASEIYWDGKQFTATTPTAAAELRSRVKSIGAPLAFRRAAKRRVAASRGSAENQAEATIEREASAKMHTQLDAAVEKLNRKAAGFLNFVARTADPPERWQTAVTSTAIEVGFMPRAISGVWARPRAMPPLEGIETLGISFHDSAIEQLFRTQLGGKRWTDVDFSVMQRELTGVNAHEHMIGLEPERWSVQWDWRRPVSIEFEPDRAIVYYRFSRAEVDGYVTRVPFEVRAEMQVSGPPLGLEMRMLEPASVASIKADAALPPQVHSLLERKFRGLFGERFSLDNLQFPAGGHLDGMSRFRVAGARHDSQWIHLRYTNRGPNGEMLVGETPGSTIGK